MSQRTPPVPIDRVARCEECYAYVSSFSEFTKRFVNGVGGGKVGMRKEENGKVLKRVTGLTCLSVGGLAFMMPSRAECCDEQIGSGRSRRCSNEPGALKSFMKGSAIESADWPFSVCFPIRYSFAAGYNCFTLFREPIPEKGRGPLETFWFNSFVRLTQM